MTTEDVPLDRPSPVVRAWRGFGRWRRSRPFWGGVLLILSGAEFYGSGHLNLTAMKVQIGPEGFLTWVIPLVLILCGLLLWFTPAQRIFYGVVGAAVAVYGLMGLNLGGFVVGMLLGIIGGSLGAAWTPAAPADAPATPEGATDEDPDEDADEEEPERDAPFDEILSGPLTDHLPTSTMSPLGVPPATAGGSYPPATGPAGNDQRDMGANGGGHLPRRTPRSLALILVASGVASAALVAAQGVRPAVAAPCPRVAITTAAPATKATAKSTTGKGATTAAGPAPAAGGTAAGGASGGGATSVAASPTPSATGSGSGNPLLNIVNGVVTGIGNLLGSGGTAATPTPTAAASPTPPPAAPHTTAPAPTRTAGPAPTGRTPTRAAPKPSHASPSPTPTGCLPPGVAKAAAVPANQPPVNQTPSTQIAATLTQSGLSYDGIVDVPTRTGTIRVLEFSMDQSVSTPFELRVPVASGHTLSIRSSKLTVSGHVSFFTTEIKGNLLGLLPVDFTPDSPPPLVIPDLFFTDATVSLVYVQSDVLTAQSLNISYSA